MTRNVDRRNREDMLDGDADEDDVIYYGIRSSRRARSFEYRDSSANRPLDFLEMEVHYSTAETIIELSTRLLAIISSIFVAYEALAAAVAKLGERVANGLAWARGKMGAIKKKIEHLVFLLSWVRANGELAFLRAEDLCVFTRRRHRFHPRHNRTIAELSRHDVDIFFGRTPHDLRRLYNHWRIPDRMRAPRSRHTYEGEECFLIFLYHLERGIPFTTMAGERAFGGDPRDMSKMFAAMVDHLYETFYHKISGTSLEQWLPHRLRDCRRLIHNRLVDTLVEERHFVNGELVDRTWVAHNFDFESFRPFGVYDCVGVATGRPGGEAVRTEDLAHDVQRAVYSGYFRGWGLKCGVVYLPIGLIGCVFISELRQNDNGVQNMSGLNDYLCQLLNGCLLVSGLFPALYTDGIFAVLATILPRFRNPTPEQRLLNLLMASVREVIEHVFADHHNLLGLFKVPEFLWLYSRGVEIRRLCMVSFFVLNSFYCLDGQRCRYFGQDPPTLEQYLPLDEVLAPPPAVDLGDTWEYP